MKNTEKLKHLFLGTAAVLSGSCMGVQAEDDRPNVLFIMMDDMCDWHNYLGGHKQVITPNLDRLAERGVIFSNAYSAVPLSNPSRASLLTSIPAYVSGVYNNNNAWQDSPQVNSALSMPEQFKNNGYETIISGKIYHTKPSAEKLNQIWDDKANMDGGYGPWPTTDTYPDRTGKWENIEEWTGPDTDFPDVHNSQKIIDFLGKTHNKPFFACMGFYRPHTPYSAPKRYFDMYDSDTLQVPLTMPDDLDDIPAYAYNHFIRGNISFQQLLSSGDQSLWRERIKAYMACVTFADDRIGMILDALDRSPYADNTIIVLVGDNGFHHGEKMRWGKSALWREAGHVPMLVVGPKGGTVPAGKRCESVVSLLDVYPTLNEMCGFPDIQPQTIYGKSLTPLLKNPSMEWDMPVVTAYLPGNFAVHSNEWSYIRYANGAEELYSTEDENEFHNLAGDSQYDEVKKEMQQYIQEEETQIIYVKPAGNGNGTSWEDAADLTSGIEIARRVENQTNHQLWLAAGTYAVSSTIAFDQIQLYGGFAGTESEIDQRDWAANPTVLDGGGAVSILRTLQTGQALADGLVIQNGYAASDNGGGVFMKGNCTLRNCIVRNNRSGTGKHGGGINMASGNNYMENCLVVNNTAGASGGGVQLGGGSSNWIVNTTIVQNVAGDNNKGCGLGLAQPTGVNGVTSLNLYNSILYANRTQNGKTYESVAQNNGNVDFPGNVEQNKRIEAEVMNTAVETTGTKIEFTELSGNIRLDRSHATQLFVSPSDIYGYVPIEQEAEYNRMLVADYSLGNTSLCIDRGDDSYVTQIVDLSGKERIKGSSVDMGAYEYGNTTSSSGFSPDNKSNRLRAFRQGDKLLLIGIDPGEFIRIYDTSGRLLDGKKATSGITEFSLDKNEVLLIVSKSGYVKVY